MGNRDTFTHIASQPVANAPSAIRFREEYYVMINPQSGDRNIEAIRFSNGELLLHRENQNNEAFFLALSGDPELAIQTDLELLTHAITHHLVTQKPVSINLTAHSFFDSRLITHLQSLKDKYPHLVLNDICLEVTEQGHIPESFNDDDLIAIRELGISLAIDDFHPFESPQWERLSKLAPHIDIIKFPYQMMESVRNPESRTFAMDYVRDVRNMYPDKLLVMEGFRKPDYVFTDMLYVAGIDFVQESDFGEKTAPHIVNHPAP